MAPTRQVDRTRASMEQAQQQGQRPPTPPPIRWPFRLFVGLTLLSLLSVILMLWAYRYRNDEYLARFIMQLRNPEMKGKMELGRVHWDASALVALAVGAPLPAEVDHFAVYDPKGTRVLYVPRATTKVDLLALLTGGHLLLYNLRTDKVHAVVQTMPGAKPGEEKMGFLEAFGSRRPSSGRGSRVEINNISIGQARLKLGFPQWSLELERLAARGSFALTGGPTEKEGVLFNITAQANSGKLTIAGTEVPLRGLNATRFKVTRDAPMDLKFKLFTRGAGAQVQAEGRLFNTFRQGSGVELALGAKQAGPLLSRFLGPAAGGAVQLKGSIKGPFSGPLIEAHVTGASYAHPPVKIEQVGGHLRLDLARGALSASKVTGLTLGGKFAGSGALNLRSSDWNGDLDLTDVDPAAAHPLLAGKLSGTARLRGTTRGLAKGLAVVDLTLKRRRKDWIPRQVALKGTIHLGDDGLNLAGVRLRGGGATAQARGTIRLSPLQPNLHLGLSVPRADRWLARLRVPPAARSLDAALQVSGRFPRLRAAGTVNATNVGYQKWRLKRVAARLSFDGETLSLSKIRSAGMGGRVHGDATLKLFRGNLRRLRRVPLLLAQVQAEGLDMAALGLPPLVKGRLWVKAHVSGPINELTGSADVKAPSMTIQGEDYNRSWARVGLLKDRVTVYESGIPRGGGGELKAWGDVFFDRRLALRLAAKDFPLEGIPQVHQLPLGIKGQINGQVNVEGTLVDPRLNGTVALTGAQIRGRQMGNGSITLTSGSDYVHVGGHLLDKLVKLDGHLLTDPNARIHLKVDVERFPLEKVFFEVRKLGNVHGLVSGTIRLDADSKRGLTWADARFPQVALTLRHRAPGAAREKVVTLSNQQDMLARWDGSQLHLVTAKMMTRVERQRGQAQFTVGGWLSADKLDVRLRGDIALEILEFFLSNRVRKLSGKAVANVNFTGPLKHPVFTGRLDLSDISIQMPNFHQPIQVPISQIKLVPGKLVLSKLELLVGRDKLTATGDLSLDRFVPKIASLDLAGDLNLKLLQLVFPRQVSSAAGATWVKLNVSGPVNDPRFVGQVGVVPPRKPGQAMPRRRRIEIVPRGLGRRITLRDGEVNFSNYLIKTTKPLVGTYDEGLVRLWGEVRLDHFDVVDLYLRIVGTGIPQRQPKVYSAEVNVDVTLAGDSRQLLLKGDMELVDVRYIRKFDIIAQALIKPRVAEEATPFWKGSPVLETLGLDLKVRSLGQILVKNNLANLSMSGDFTVTGTLVDPRLGGLIRVEEGTFKLPMTRGEFTISLGEIMFAKHKPLDQGEINIGSETVFEARDSVAYKIEMKVKGPLNKPGIELTSSPSLDQGQIWSMLLFGRTTDQLRSQLRGGDGRQSASPAAGAADAQVKQLTGEILSQIIEDPLKKVTRLDVISLEVGTESAQIRARKKLGRYISLAGEYELGLLGDTRAEGRLEIKMHDLLMLVGKWERLSTRLDTEEQDPSRGRLELKFRLPLRW